MNFTRLFVSLASLPGSFSVKGLGTRLLVSIGGTSVTYGVIQTMRYISHGRAFEVCKGDSQYSERDKIIVGNLMKYC